MNEPAGRYSEPLRTTLLRTVTIALVVGAFIARPWAGGMARWPRATLIALWPALGGHFVELWFLNWLRPRLPAGRAAHVVARIAVWFAGGMVLAIAMLLTAAVLDGFAIAADGARRVMMFTVIGGAAFVAIELVVHLVLQFAGRPSFYNGRG